MNNLRNRAAEKARRAASGGDGPPAGQDPASQAAPATADRRRVRGARRARDARLHELGALLMEMYRQDRHNPAPVERKAREAIAADAEVRALDGSAATPPPSPAQRVDAPAPPPEAAARVEPVPPAGAPVAAAPPSAEQRVEAPSELSAPPPSESDRVDRPASDDDVPTYTVTSP